MTEMQMSAPVGGDILGSMVVLLGAIGTLFAFGVAVRATVWPGERSLDHPKYLIMRDDR